MNKMPIYSLEKEELAKWLLEACEKRFRTEQIWEWLYQKRVKTFTEMTNLPNKLQEKLDRHFTILPLKLVEELISKDGTKKFLFSLEDGNMIETVLMINEYGLSICVSTQVGCKMGCNFCASSLEGFFRNLSCGEITAQVISIQRQLDKVGKRIRSVVIMGIGEPFDNYEQVMKFIKIINDEHGLKIGARHITVSTCGIVPKIYEFAHEGFQVNFAISLHATTDEVRSKLMPINNKYVLADVIAAAKYYTKNSNRRVTFEFGLMADINDSPAEAKRLAELVRGIKCHINLIPINYVSQRGKKSASPASVKKFLQVLLAQGINATVRRKQGDDISGACGQLRLHKMRF